jgi:oxalate decarboxylase/phosphoglucose isomerase-like protein (cupin superfamily)
VEITPSAESPLLFFDDERIYTRIFPTTSEFGDAAMSRIEPGVSQRYHIHNRPSGGVEIIFVYAGRFKIRSENRVDGDRIFDVESEGPIYISVPSGTPCSLINVGDKPVDFFAVFCPPFAQGEIQYIEPL